MHGRMRMTGSTLDERNEGFGPAFDLRDIETDAEAEATQEEAMTTIHSERAAGGSLPGPQGRSEFPSLESWSSSAPPAISPSASCCPRSFTCARRTCCPAISPSSASRAGRSAMSSRPTCAPASSSLAASMRAIPSSTNSSSTSATSRSTSTTRRLCRTQNRARSHRQGKEHRRQASLLSGNGARVLCRHR